eukprot:3082655-Rhodomonas_salina.1
MLRETGTTQLYQTFYYSLKQLNCRFYYSLVPGVPGTRVPGYPGLATGLVERSRTRALSGILTHRVPGYPGTRVPRVPANPSRCLQ